MSFLAPLLAETQAELGGDLVEILGTSASQVERALEDLAELVEAGLSATTAEERAEVYREISVVLAEVHNWEFVAASRAQAAFLAAAAKVLKKSASALIAIATLVAA